MKIPNPIDKFFQDENGQWWKHISADNKARCTVLACPICGEDFIRQPGHYQQFHCSRKCAGVCRSNGECAHVVGPPKKYVRKGKDTARWKGGRRLDPRGYVLIWMPHHHSIAHNPNRKYVGEHRLVMEQILQRLLKPNETVHHKNGIRDDNRPENLELWENQPYGQRIEEIKHCKTCQCNN